MGADRRAFELAGMFDAGVPYGFDEDMWERRLRERGGTVMYVARAGLVHRRDARDARLGPLMRAAYQRGRSLRAYIEHRGAGALGGPRAARAGRLRLAHLPPPLRQRPAAHGALRRPRARAARAMSVDELRPRARALGRERNRRRAAAGVRAAGCATSPTTRPRWLTLEPLRVARAADRLPRRRVLVLGIYAPDGVGSHGAGGRGAARPPPRRAARARRAGRDRRRPWPQYTALDGLEGAGKFENLNRLLAASAGARRDWTLVVDDDVELPRGFLGRFLACAEGLGLQLAQPAHRHTSHAAWAVTRRARWTLARRTRLVEIGPVTAFHSLGRGRAAAVPAAADGLGARRALGRARARARLAPRRRRRDADPARVAGGPPTATTAAPQSRKLRSSCPGKPFVERDAAPRGGGAPPVA